MSRKFAVVEMPCNDHETSLRFEASPEDDNVWLYRVKNDGSQPRTTLATLEREDVEAILSLFDEMKR